MTRRGHRSREVRVVAPRRRRRDLASRRGEIVGERRGREGRGLRGQKWAASGESEWKNHRRGTPRESERIITLTPPALESLGLSR